MTDPIAKYMQKYRNTTEYEKSILRDLWHYPSKGEFPEINEIVFLYLKGSVYKPGCFMCVSEKNYEWCIDCDRNKEVDRSEVLAWQYIVPPKEEA